MAQNRKGEAEQAKAMLGTGSALRRTAQHSIAMAKKGYEKCLVFARNFGKSGEKSQTLKHIRGALMLLKKSNPIVRQT